MTYRTPRVALALLVLVGVAACGGDDSSDDAEPADTTVAETFQAQVASYDLAADAPQRFIVGLLAGEGGLVVGGKVGLRFEYLGDSSTSTSTVDAPTLPPATATFTAVADGEPAASGPKPRQGSEGVGVYEADDISFAKAGFWQVEVTARFAGKEQTALAAFEVGDTAKLPAAGDPAPRTQNLLPGAADAPPKAVDSRAEDDGTVPDPQLHRLTVDQAISTGKPTLVVVSTPVFCVSRFCGPITDAVDAMATEYGDRANFVHIEVWRDFEGKAINRAAAEWIYPDQSVDAREPWVFLVDGSGTIVRRWDNVANGAQMRAALDQIA